MVKDTAVNCEGRGVLKDWKNFVNVSQIHLFPLTRLHEEKGGGTSGEENLRGWLDETSVSHKEKQSNQISLSSVTAAGNSCAEGGGEQSLTTVSPLSKSAAEEKVKNKKKQNPSEAPSSSSSSWGNVVQMWIINFLFPVAGWTLVVAPPLLIGPIIFWWIFSIYACIRWCSWGALWDVREN